MWSTRHNNRLLCGLIALLVHLAAAVQILAAPTVHSEPSSALMESRLDELIQTAMNQTNTPSVSVAVSKHDKLVWNKTYGLTNLESGRPAQWNALYNVASVTKMFTALAAMQLVEQGLLDLDGDVSRFLPFQLRSVHYPDTVISLRALLSHVSAINDDVWGDAFSDKNYGHQSMELAMLLPQYLCDGGRYFVSKNWNQWEPLAKYQYSNVGIATVGLAIEQVTGTSYIQYVKQHVLQPLGMHDAFWYASDMPSIDLAYRMAMPYAMTKLAKHVRTNIPLGFTQYPDIPAGNLKTTAVSIVSLLMTVWQNGTTPDGVQLVRPESMVELQKVQYPHINNFTALAFEYSHGALTDQSKPQRLRGFGHSGWDDGMNADVWLYLEGPHAGIGFAVMANGDDCSDNAPPLQRITDFGDSPVERAIVEFAAAYL